MRVVILSPHLDDAALSVGAFAWRAAKAGHAVEILTVFANDPARRGPAHAWDARCGFSTAQEAAAVRRSEDARACEILGATPHWLPLPEFGYQVAGPPEGLENALLEATDRADVVMAPAFPLRHPDHRVVLDALAKTPTLLARSVGYVEQPYAGLRTPRRDWIRQGRLSCTAYLGVDAFRRSRVASAAKRAATAEYRSQLPHLGSLAQPMLTASYWLKGETPMAAPTLGALAPSNGSPAPEPD